MEIETSSTETAIAADAIRAGKNVEQSEETKNSVDSNGSETSKESETLEDARGSEESGADDSQDDENQEIEETEGDEGKEVDKKSDLPKGVKKRLGRITKQREQARQEAEFWKREALKQNQTQSEPQKLGDPAQANQAASNKPHAEDFESHEDWIEALTDWKVEQRERANEEKRTAAEQKANREAFSQKLDAFKETHDDFDEVMDDIKGVNFSPGINDAIFGSELGLELAYELAKNPTEFKRICSLSDVQAIKELGKFEATLSQKSGPPKTNSQTTTKAPPPPTPLNGKSDKAVKKSIYDKDLSFEEYERLRLEQLKQ